MNSHARTAQRALAATGILFGIITIVAGTRVLTGGDPGYVVFFPLLIYNTVMGFAYISAGAVAWRRLHGGRNAAAAIFALNLLVLVAIWILHSSGAAVAVDSLRAMTLRTVIWLALFTGLAWLKRSIGTSGP